MPKQSRITNVMGINGVPDYKIEQFTPKANKYVICVFVLNEGERVRAQLARMNNFSNILDIVVVDGGSTDNSLDPEYLASNNVTALLTKKGEGKLSAQMRMSFHFAKVNGYEGVITVDGNGKDGVEAVPQFINLLDEGFDHIQGSRYIPGGRHENTPLSRHLALKYIHAPLISLASGTHQTDTTNGFRGYSSRFLNDPELDVFRDIFQTYEMHYYLAIEAGRIHRFKTTETPVSRTYPKKGKIPTKISPIRGNAHVLGILIESVLGKYRPNQKENESG